MDNNTAAVIIEANSKVVFGSSLFGGMTLFQDPAYIIIGIVGALVSMGSAHYDFKVLKKEVEVRGGECQKELFMEIGKAGMLGLLFSIFSFMLFLNIGDEIIKTYITSKVAIQILPSIWMLLTILLATWTVTIHSKITGKVKGVK